MYVDVEGDPDRGFYYLIGVRVCRDGSYVQYSFWADDPASEKIMWADFLNVLAAIKDVRIVHYGSYETTCFKRLRERYGECLTSGVGELIKNAVNMLSVIHDHVYFPTYSNSLKDIAHYLKFHWSEDSSSGLRTLLWRSHFESSRDLAWKAHLVSYNADDCEALQVVAEKVWTLASTATIQESGGAVDAATIKREYPQRFGDVEFVLPEFNIINEAAYWDYQRSRIYVRTLPKQSKAHTHKNVNKVEVRPDKVVFVDECRPQRCPYCGGMLIYKWGTLSQRVYDLRLSGVGVKRWIVRFVFHRFLCWNCKRPIQLYVQKPKYGTVLIAYVLYQLLEMHLPQNLIGQSLARILWIAVFPWWHQPAQRKERRRNTAQPTTALFGRSLTAT